MEYAIVLVFNGKGSGLFNEDCKKITIAVFKSGKIIITGGKNIEQVNIVYNFIKDLLIKNKSKFIIL